MFTKLPILKYSKAISALLIVKYNFALIRKTKLTFANKNYLQNISIRKECIFDASQGIENDDDEKSKKKNSLSRRLEMLLLYLVQ